MQKALRSEGKINLVEIVLKFMFIKELFVEARLREGKRSITFSRISKQYLNDLIIGKGTQKP